MALSFSDCTVNGLSSVYNSTPTYSITGGQIRLSYPYVGIIKFSTLDFNGVSSRVLICPELLEHSDAITFRYALCTSDNNIWNYFDTKEDVEDSYQIASGQFSAESVYGSVGVEIKTDKLLKNHTYYFIMWASNGLRYLYNDSRIYNATVYYFDGGIVYINNGSEFEPYICYIDNGTSWEAYIPCIDNGTSWDICN